MSRPGDEARDDDDLREEINQRADARAQSVHAAQDPRIPCGAWEERAILHAHWQTDDAGTGSSCLTCSTAGMDFGFAYWDALPQGKRPVRIFPGIAGRRVFYVVAFRCIDAALFRNRL
jgi:hypothetical protein